MKTAFNSANSSLIRMSQAKVGILAYLAIIVDTYSAGRRLWCDIYDGLQKYVTSAHGYRYRLTIIDRFTRWPEAIPLKDITAQSRTEALCREWIPRFGVLAVVITERGIQFESTLFSDLGKLLGFKRQRTTTYHSQSNGMLERWHQTLKSAIMARDGPSWTQVMLSFYSAYVQPAEKNLLSALRSWYAGRTRDSK